MQSISPNNILSMLLIFEKTLASNNPVSFYKSMEKENVTDSL